MPISLSGSLNLSGSLTTTGTITATTLVVQTITSSISSITGSTNFGSLSANTHTFTGSLNVTGSLSVVTTGTEFQVNSTGVNLGNALTDSHIISGSLTVNPGGLFVSGSGNVGINTTSPSSKLHVVGSSLTDTFRITDASNYTIVMGYSGSANVGMISTLGGTAKLALGTNSAARLTIDGTGNVGIGTVSPSQLFEVVGGEIKAGRVDSSNEGGQVSFGRSTDNATAWYIDAYGNTASPQLRFVDVTGAAVRMTITGSNVGIGIASPTEILHLNSSNTAAFIRFQNTGGSGTYLGSRNTDMEIYTGGAERMRITSGGEVLMHATSFNSTLVGQFFGTGGDTYLTAETSQILYINRKGNDGTLVDFRRDNSVKGTISVSGETVSYNSFLGSHWSQLIDNSKPEILKGTILEAINELCTWEGETNDRLPKVKISDTIESKNVYGIFLDWDNDDTINNDMYVAAVGAGYIRVNSNEIVQMGDLLQSNGDGTAKIQSDNIMLSSTIAKVVSTNKIETYEDGSYLVAATLHCG
jgi:hypothetical protein